MVKTMSVPRSEYPRPQFERSQWLCLNGEWQFEIDAVDSGTERGLLNRGLNSAIIVPFCPESKLSGVEHVDFMAAIWYRREVTIPSEWTGKNVLLHFQASDYDTTVWVNGVEVTRHRGGSTPFHAELGPDVKAGEQITIVVRVRDDWKGPQPRGKQTQRFGNHGCLYTRTTGIWQTVWMEPVASSYLQRTRITPRVSSSSVDLVQPVRNGRPGQIVRATLSDDRGPVATVEMKVGLDFYPAGTLNIPEDRSHLWSIEDPFLYNLTLELLSADGTIIDTVNSYTGLRSIAIDGRKIRINGKSVFQRLVLDQGYYNDGLLTAPTEEDLLADITLSMDAGFNGARLHQKIFEERFLYHCDRLGYIVWGEFPDWGCGGYGLEHDHQQPPASYITQWLEELERDYSHPSIVGWCGLNETWQPNGDTIVVLDDVTRGMFLAAKAMDSSRPVLDTSGYSHRILDTDVYDSHDYLSTQDFWTEIEVFKARHAKIANNDVFMNRHNDKPMSTGYLGQPYFISEFGGLWWNAKEAQSGGDSWGYGARPTSEEEFVKRFKALCDILLDNEEMFGYCYTQLTDVFQEQNGIFYFDRSKKFDMSVIKAIQTRKAAIED